MNQFYRSTSIHERQEESLQEKIRKTKKWILQSMPPVFIFITLIFLIEVIAFKVPHSTLASFLTVITLFSGVVLTLYVNHKGVEKNVFK